MNPFRLLLLTGLILLCSCGERSILEPSDPPAELVKAAVVRTPSPVFRGGKDLIKIKTIDGTPPTFLDTKAVVPPGKHTFQVELELHHPANDPKHSYATRADTSLTFAVEAQHEYLIDALEDENGVWLWATDLSDGTVVAGDPPRNLPPEQRVRPMWQERK